MFHVNGCIFWIAILINIQIAIQKPVLCGNGVIGRASVVFVLRDVTRFTVLSPRLEQ